MTFFRLVVMCTGPVHSRKKLNPYIDNRLELGHFPLAVNLSLVNRIIDLVPDDLKYDLLQYVIDYLII